ncbi:MAG: patatin-like phospholipase family protein [Marinifilaceae bacterium]
MKQKVALVLASGGARGVAHIGVIEELEKRGYEIASVSGTSMGALIGGIYCAGGLDVYKDWMCHLDKFKVFSLVDFTIARNGVVKGERVLHEIKRMVPDMTIEELRIKFTAVATDIMSGEEVVFDKGSLFDAIRASISIPSLFVPYKIGDRLFVDGAVTNPLPLNRVAREEGDIVVAVDLSALDHIGEKEKEKAPEVVSDHSPFQRVKKLLMERGYMFTGKEHNDSCNYSTVLLQASDIMLRRITELNLQLYKPDILIDIPREYNILEFYKSEEIIEQGRRAAQLALDKYAGRK